jgi:hypothetical protein
VTDCCRPFSSNVATSSSMSVAPKSVRSVPISQAYPGRAQISTMC